MKSFFIFLLLLIVFGCRQPVNLRDEVTFCATYEQCRNNFISSITDFTNLNPEEKKRTTIGKWRVPSRIDDSLFIDYAYIKPVESPKNLVILSSGVHGVEGFAGSTIQSYFTKEILPLIDRKHLGILMIHGVNPYGFKYLRRVSENNIDLNRNFDTTPNLFHNKNLGYSRMSGLLNPTERASAGYLARLIFYYEALQFLWREPIQTLRQAVLQGQYQQPKGIYYGGNHFEPHRALMEPFLRSVGKNYRDVLALDLHSGYGNPGVLHLMPTSDRAGVERLRRDFSQFKFDLGDAKDFYETSGDFSAYLQKLFTTKKIGAISMTLEYGTVGNQGYYWGMESLRRMVLENQAHHYGSVDDASTDKIKKLALALYFPGCRTWRRQIIVETREKLPGIIQTFSRAPVAKITP